MQVDTSRLCVKHLPAHIAARAEKRIQALREGARYEHLGGHRHTDRREIIAVPVGRRYRLVMREMPSGDYFALAVDSHETYNKKDYTAMSTSTTSCTTRRNHKQGWTLHEVDHVNAKRQVSPDHTAAKSDAKSNAKSDAKSDAAAGSTATDNTATDNTATVNTARSITVSTRKPLTVAVVAEVLKLSEKRVYQLIHKGKLTRVLDPTRRHRGKPRILVADDERLEEHMARRANMLSAKAETPEAPAAQAPEAARTERTPEANAPETAASTAVPAPLPVPLSASGAVAAPAGIDYEAAERLMKKAHKHLAKYRVLRAQAEALLARV